MFYTKINNDLLRNENLKANTKILLLVIMSYESKEGYSYPSHSRLMKETGLSKSTLIKCLKELEELGYIISEKAAGNNNKYFIDSSIKISSSKNDSSTKNDTSSSNKNDTVVVLNLVHKNKQENKQNNNSDLEVIVEAYTDNKELKETIIDFIEMRKSIKKKLTERALKTILNKLDKIALNDFEKIEILENSIVNCWQGVFEIKKEAHNTGANQNYRYNSICSNSKNNSNMRVHNDF